jgi:hypothetical protein
MSQPVCRRRFLQSAAVGGLSGIGSIPEARGGEARPVPEPIRFGSDLEPIVRLIEETPREKWPAKFPHLDRLARSRGASYSQ